MLVLSRKIGDSIRIDGEIEVTVLAVHGQKIKLGIKAPRETAIRRSELRPLDAIDQARFASTNFLTTGNG